MIVMLALSALAPAHTKHIAPLLATGAPAPDSGGSVTPVTAAMSVAQLKSHSSSRRAELGIARVGVLAFYLVRPSRRGR